MCSSERKVHLTPTENIFLAHFVKNMQNCIFIDSICTNASSRLFFLQMLNRCSLSIDDLLYFTFIHQLFGQHWSSVAQ